MSEIWAILVNCNGFKIPIVVGVAVNVENWYLSRHEIFLPQKILENMQKKKGTMEMLESNVIVGVFPH